MIILTKTPLWILGILAALLTLIAMSGPLLVRKRISLERLSTNNEVAGFKFATIGVIYARGAAVMAELLRQLDLLGHARRARLVIAAGIVPNVVWVVLFGGAVVTIGFTFLFATKNLRHQVAMTGGLSGLIFSILLVIIAIDHPFAGSISVDSGPLATVLADHGGVNP